MSLWIAVPESEDGTWYANPIGADTRAEVKLNASRRWRGNLPDGVEVVVYCCQHDDVLDLQKREPSRPSCGLSPDERTDS